MINSMHNNLQTFHVNHNNHQFQDGPKTQMGITPLKNWLKTIGYSK